MYETMAQQRKKKREVKKIRTHNFASLYVNPGTLECRTAEFTINTLD